MEAIPQEDRKILDSFTQQVREAIMRKGIVPFTEIQRKGMPAVLSGSNVLMVSPTGTGKTEAAMLPVFHFLKTRVYEPGTGFRVLYITPLRALNRDLLDRLSWWSTFLDIGLGVRHGDTLKTEREHQALHPPEVLVTTPETFQILLVGKRLSSHLRQVRWVVIDEIHELAEDKRGTQLVVGLEKLLELAGSPIQVMGLSATVGDPYLLGRFMVGEGRRFVVAEATPEKSLEIDLAIPEPDRDDFRLSEETFENPSVLARLRFMDKEIREHESTLLFTNTRATAETLSNKFVIYKRKLPLAIHHGSLGISTRLIAERGLKGGTFKGVVTTSSLELGIDVGLVDFVLQYGSPRQATHLVQRVGRSGHAVKGVSKGVIVAIDEEDLMEAIVLRNRALRKDLERIEIPIGPLDVIAHQVAGLVMRRGNWHLEEIVDLLRRSFPYSELSIDQASSVMQFMHSRYPSLLSYDQRSGIVRRGTSSASLYKFYFDHLSTIPEVKQYLVSDAKNKEVVGILDEEFVAEKGLPGTKFVMAAKVWSIDSVEAGKVIVNRMEDPSGAVPFWQGEEIPVKFEAAREVGKFRREILEALQEGKSPDEIADLIAIRDSISKSVAQKAIEPVLESQRRGYPIATDQGVVIELWTDKLIFHACNGDQVNSALAKILGTLLSDAEHVIATSRDPYRVIVDYEIEPERALTEILSLNEQRIEELLVSGIESVGLFKRRLVHVGRRFGVISKEADLTSGDVDKLALELKGTCVFEEARKELMQKDYDSTNLARFIGELKKGLLDAKFISGSGEASPFAAYALRNVERKVDLFPPDKADKILLKYAMARLKNQVLHLMCTENLHYLGPFRVSDIEFPLRCNLCGSGYVGVIPEEESARMAKFRPRSRAGKLALDNARKSSLLLYRYGEPAALALASRLLKLRDIEVLLSANKNEEDLTRSIVELERSRAFKRTGST